ncbi:MAG TPA: hypothetical protein VM869_03925, partial [Enhygromyxa sp.]|nr:hypothetical protein [Enhygromyxa sp.]
MSLRDVPIRWGLVLSLGIAVLGCTSQTQTSNPASASHVEPPASQTASAPAMARPVTDDRRADGLFAYTDPGELPQLRVSAEAEPLPLEHTAVDGRVLRQRECVD